MAFLPLLPRPMGGEIAGRLGGGGCCCCQTQDDNPFPSLLPIIPINVFVLPRNYLLLEAQREREGKKKKKPPPPTVLSNEKSCVREEEVGSYLADNGRGARGTGRRYRAPLDTGI